MPGIKPAAVASDVRVVKAELPVARTLLRSASATSDLRRRVERRPPPIRYLIGVRDSPKSSNRRARPSLARTMGGTSPACVLLSSEGLPSA